MCDCDLYQKIRDVFPNIMECDYDKYYAPIVSENGSLNIGNWASKRIYTEGFTENMKDIQMICPEHHPFFRFLMEEKLNLDFCEYSKCIYHAWYHIPSQDLKLLWGNEEKYVMKIEKLRFGLEKAWKKFIKNRHANVTTYHYDDSGGLSTDSEEAY